MIFAVMVWNSPHSRVPSIFGVLDKANPAQLPLIGKGHWEDYRTIDESKFPLAEEAKQAIAAQGYHLIGAGSTFEQAFGDPP